MKFVHCGLAALQTAGFWDGPFLPFTCQWVGGQRDVAVLLAHVACQPGQGCCNFSKADFFLPFKSSLQWNITQC